MISDQVGVMRFLFVINDHCLDIREHILSLAEAPIFHLTLLNALHSNCVFDAVITTQSVFFVAALSSALVKISTVTGMNKRLKSLMVHIHPATLSSVSSRCRVS